MIELRTSRHNQALILSESHVGLCDTVALVVGNDLHTAIFVDAYAGVNGNKVNAVDFKLEASPDKALDTKERLRWVLGNLIPCCLTNQALILSESHVGWWNTVALVVGSELHAAIFVDAYT